LPTIKCCEVMVGGEFFDPGKCGLALAHSITLFSPSNRARAGLAVTGRSSAS
jgi:hypothetical protein